MVESPLWEHLLSVKEFRRLSIVRPIPGQLPPESSWRVQLRKRLGANSNFVSKVLGIEGKTLSLIEGNTDTVGADITEFTGYVMGTDENSKIQAYGRPACVLALGDESGQHWYTINGKDGKFELLAASLDENGSVRWSLIRDLMSQALETERPIGATISSDGRYLVVCSSKQAAAIDLQEQKVIQKWADYQLAQWRPASTELVLAKRDGSVRIASLDNLVGTESKITLEEGKQVQKISWHRENLTQQDQAITKWHLIALEKSDKSEGLAFYEVNGNQLVPNQTPLRIPRNSISAFTSSPLDGTLAIGTGFGDVSLWFVSPTTDKQPRELFSIDEHRGVKVSDLRFSQDGTTLYSGDSPASKSSKSRAHGWTAIMNSVGGGNAIASN